MGWLWDQAAREEVLARLRKLAALPERSTTQASGWRLALPEGAVTIDVGEVNREGVDDVVGPKPRSPRRGRRYLGSVAVALALLAIAVIGVRKWVDDAASRPGGVVLTV